MISGSDAATSGAVSNEDKRGPHHALDRDVLLDRWRTRTTDSDDSDTASPCSISGDKFDTHYAPHLPPSNDPAPTKKTPSDDSPEATVCTVSRGDTRDAQPRLDLRERQDRMSVITTDPGHSDGSSIRTIQSRDLRDPFRDLGLRNSHTTRCSESDRRSSRRESRRAIDGQPTFFRTLSQNYAAALGTAAGTVTGTGALVLAGLAGYGLAGFLTALEMSQQRFPGQKWKMKYGF